MSYAVTAIAPAVVGVPRFRIEGRMLDDDGVTVLADFTGANAVIFPDCTTRLSLPQAMALFSDFGPRLLHMLAGLE